MLVDLHKDLDAAKLGAVDSEQLRLEAERELERYAQIICIAVTECFLHHFLFNRAKAEAESAEQTLQSDVDSLTALHQRYDDLKARAKEERDLGRAEDFFATNKTILKAAYG